MAEQGGDGQFCHAQIAGDRAEGMAQRMRCHARYAGPILRMSKTQQPLRCGAEFATLSDEERIGYDRCFRETTRQANADCARLRRFRSSIRVGFLDLSAAIEAGKESTTK